MSVKKTTTCLLAGLCLSPLAAMAQTAPTAGQILQQENAPPRAPTTEAPRTRIEATDTAATGGSDTVAVAGIIDIHGVYQQKIGLVTQAQTLGIHEQVGVRIVVGVVEVPVLNRQARVAGMAVAHGDKGRAVIQLTDPVVGRRRGGQASRAGEVKQALLIRQAHDLVVYDATFDGRAAGQQALVERA